MRRIVGLCGEAGVGKDTICAALGFQRAAFADALKADLAPIFAKLPPHTKEQIRPVLVAYGRAARQIDPDYWLGRVVIPETGNICFTDIRYANEALHVRSLGGTVVRLRRHGIGPANEEEARSLRDVDATLNLITIWNVGTPEETASKVLELLECESPSLPPLFA